MRPVELFVFLAALSAGLSGCTRESNAQASPPPESQFMVLNQGQAGKNVLSAKKQTKVLSSLNDYVAELANYTDDPALAIDFVTARYLLVDMGMRPSAGYSVGVISIDVTDDSVTANVKLTKPGPNCVVQTVLTSPYQFVFIPTAKEVLVSEKVEVRDC